MKKAMFCILIIILIVIPITTAKQGNLKLLAIMQKGENLSGSMADLHLEIKPGTGRVFVDTFPLTKLDTQVSTRFAKEIACDYLDANCGNYDFFYTIRSRSPIIAGPSAGAAITVLTISLLGEIGISKDVAITGTINSGGLIGPVGGLKEKIEAASKNGIKKVLIPFGERFITSFNLKDLPEIIDENKTAKEILEGQPKLDLEEYGKELGITVREVSDIDDVIFEYTGKKKEYGNREIQIDEDYKQTMQQLAKELCQRSNGLADQLALQNIPNEEPYHTLYMDAVNLTEKGTKVMQAGRMYSTASYCFGANVKFGAIVLFKNNESDEEILERIKTIEDELEEFKIPHYKTIRDLQAYMIVEERIEHAKEFIEQSKNNLAEGKRDEALYDLAYAIERKFSAYAWSMFITGKGKTFRLSQADLRDSCEKKLSEAEERYQYVNLFLPSYLANIRKRIDDAYMDFNHKDYESCLFKASRAKAEIDVILSVFGVEKENLDDLIDRKLETVEKMILRQSEKGIFPILGFSYYEYANDLKDSDKFSSLLYGEYALEMGNLNIYFPERKEITLTDQDKGEIGIFLIGLGAGLLIGVIIILYAKKTKKRKKK